MGRLRKVYIDPDELLRGIDREHRSQEAELKRGFHGYYLRELRLWGPKCNVAHFLGRELSSTERLRAQQTLRALEARGLVDILGLTATRVMLTDAGRAHLAALDAEAPAP